MVGEVGLGQVRLWYVSRGRERFGYVGKGWMMLGTVGRVLGEARVFDRKR